MGWPAGPRGPGSRSLDSTRRSHARPGRPGELAAGGSQAGAWSIQAGRYPRWRAPKLDGYSPATDASTGERRARKLASGVRRRAGGKGRWESYLACGLSYWILVIRGTKTQAQDIKEACKTFLRDELGLELSEEKTKITHIEEGFEFLGFRIFRCNKASNRRKVGVFVRPTDKGLKRVQVKIKAMTTRSTLNDDYVYKIQAINAVIRGWATYYRAVNPTETFNKLDRYVWLRLKKWLEKKYEIGPKEVKRRYMSHQPGPKGGRDEFAAQETDETWVWRYRATQTKLIYHRPTIKRHWPHPYLEKVKVEQYVLPTMKDMWQGNSAAPMYATNRREVLKRATGACERCGRATKLTVHHRHRVKWSKKPMQADHRPEGMEALCKSCHVKEHRAELVVSPE